VLRSRCFGLATNKPRSATNLVELWFCLSFLPSSSRRKEGETGGGTAKGTAVLLRSSTQNNRRFFAMVKPDKQDFDAIEKKYGPLPANASER
jgi:hypothetical protein